MEFDNNSTGLDWNEATSLDKFRYAELMAKALFKLNKEADTKFIIEALDSFYDSDEEGILKMPINQILSLCVATNKNLQ